MHFNVDTKFNRTRFLETLSMSIEIYISCNNFGDVSKNHTICCLLFINIKINSILGDLNLKTVNGSQITSKNNYSLSV